MARITVEDCIRHYPNRFELVLLAARRARQLQNGMEPLCEDASSKPTVQSLREIGDGLMTWEALFELEEQERRRLEAMEASEAEEESTQ